MHYTSFPQTKYQFDSYSFHKNISYHCLFNDNTFTLFFLPKITFWVFPIFKFLPLNPAYNQCFSIKSTITTAPALPPDNLVLSFCIFGSDISKSILSFLSAHFIGTFRTYIYDNRKCPNAPNQTLFLQSFYDVALLYNFNCKSANLYLLLVYFGCKLLSLLHSLYAFDRQRKFRA